MPQPYVLAGQMVVVLGGHENHRAGRLLGHVGDRTLVDEAGSLPVAVLNRGRPVAGPVLDRRVVLVRDLFDRLFLGPAVRLGGHQGDVFRRVGMNRVVDPSVKSDRAEEGNQNRTAQQADRRQAGTVLLHPLQHPRDCDEVARPVVEVPPSLEKMQDQYTAGNK